MNTRIACIGLGANLPSIAGPPKATLFAAIARLGSLGTVMAQSSFYETDPVGYLAQPRFINAAVTLKTEMSPLDLLDKLLAIEREFGRDRTETPAKGPRTLDLDLLLMDDLIVNNENNDRLVLPHPEMTTRRFVLAPLAEIAPNLVHPLSGVTIATLLQQLHDQGENPSAPVKIS